MNSVILIGNLASDVELREFGEDKRRATFRLAVDRNGKDADADFFQIVVWDRQAQLCADYLVKGRKIAVEGRLRRRTWEDEGQKRSVRSCRRLSRGNRRSRARTRRAARRSAGVRSPE
jgi:single-strand DNA-binding protein